MIKPPRESTDPNLPRQATLKNSKATTHALGYVLISNHKVQTKSGAPALEFIEDDPEPLRKATLTLKTKPGFHVYYKHAEHWYGVPTHFTTLAQTIPYLQSGIRCLVEYSNAPN